jgi:hypothetical protein
MVPVMIVVEPNGTQIGHAVVDQSARKIDGEKEIDNVNNDSHTNTISRLYVFLFC